MTTLLPFLIKGIEVTGDPAFSMFNLSLKDDWVNSKKFCNRLAEEEPLDEEGKQASKVLKQFLLQMLFV